MGTRGFKLIKFRGRYYRFYNLRDSYPDCLGEHIARGIPKDPLEYAKWLKSQREEAAGWDDAIQRALCIRRSKDLQDNKSCGNESDKDDDQRWFSHIPYMEGGRTPNYLPEFNDIWIEWVYIIDLDREVFTVDHGAHFKLDKIPQGWKNTLAQDDFGLRLLLPSLVPEDSISSLDAYPDGPTIDSQNACRGLGVRLVTPKGIQGFDPSRRHGLIIRARLFQLFQASQICALTCLLRGWQPTDLHFREIAYAVLCFASGSQNVSLEHSSQLKENDIADTAGYMDLMPGKNETGSKPEFLTLLGMGCHLEGNPQGSAPGEITYWFEGVLVYLVARLDSQAVVAENTTRAVQRCREAFPHRNVPAILLSIEHVLLMAIMLSEVKSTEPLPLFILGAQPSLHPKQRYSKSELAVIQRRYEPLEGDPDSIIQPEGVSSNASASVSDSDIYNTEPAFFALAKFLESAQRVPMLATSIIERNLPREICESIMENIDDAASRRVCMRTTPAFRNIFQENVKVNEELVSSANQDTRMYERVVETFDRYPHWKHLRPMHLARRTESDPGKGRPPAFNAFEVSTQSMRQYRLVDTSKCRGAVAKEPHWRVVLGNERDRRSVLRDVKIKLQPEAEDSGM